MNVINIDDFARQLIADKCSALIESERMLPDNILAFVKEARDAYFRDPTPQNYSNIKKLFSQTKYIDDAIDYKDFNRRILLIAFKFGLNTSKEYFKAYKPMLESALKSLDRINPDLKSSPRAMLQHYNECLEGLDSPVNDEHHLITFGREIATKIFIETIDMYSSGSNKSPIEFEQRLPIAAASSSSASSSLMIAAANLNERKRKRHVSFKVASALFQL
uniref:p106 n=1 Tax=Ophiusa disjungens nucleopolyhedrovirus TaxID=521523 RepID=B6E2B9_9ABAC|nr:P106 [Ophiusa disjungens nucleopolyhedrovirus]